MEVFQTLNRKLAENLLELIPNLLSLFEEDKSSVLIYLKTQKASISRNKLSPEQFDPSYE